MIPMWMHLVNAKKEKEIKAVPAAPVKVPNKPVYDNLDKVAKVLFKDEKAVPAAPVKAPNKPVYDNLDKVAKALFKEETNDNIESEEQNEEEQNEEHEEEQNEEEHDDNQKKCKTIGCNNKFSSDNDKILRCDTCREKNIGLVIPCAHNGCTDYAKMTHKQIRDRAEKNLGNFTFCWEHSMSEGYTTVWAYDEKCKTNECDGRIQLNQGKLDFYKQPHMKMRLYCFDCLNDRKNMKNTEIECDCATCDNKVFMLQSQVTFLEKNYHLVGCSDCRKFNRVCANTKCKKDFHSINREAEMKAKYKDKFVSPVCCSKECFLLFSKK
jgi:hypothetical protein